MIQAKGEFAEGFREVHCKLSLLPLGERPGKRVIARMKLAFLKPSP
jgi:hypothetical protein